MTEIEEELRATLADVRRARNEAADLVVRTARERDAAVASAEAAEAERDAANALGAETTVQLKSAQYHLGVMVKAWEAAEARIAAALALHAPDERNGVTTCSTCEAVDWPCPTAAALVEPVGPKEDA